MIIALVVIGIIAAMVTAVVLEVMAWNKNLKGK